MENIIKVAIGLSGSVASYLWGGWSAMLQTLLLFVFIDYITGLIAAGKQGKLSSQTGFWGILSKISIFSMVAVAHMVDQTLGENHLFRDGVTTFYLCNEALSIIENAGKMGLSVPESLVKVIQVLRDNQEKSEEEKHHDDSNHTKTNSKDVQ